MGITFITFIPLSNYQNVILRNPTPPEFPVDGVPTWPLWHDEDRKYLTIDSTPEVHDEYLLTWETPDVYNP